MAEPTLFIVNPHSGGGRTGRRWPRWQQLLEHCGVPVRVQFTESNGHATELVRHALRDGAWRVVAVGGDGTLNEAVNGYLDTAGQPVNRDAVLGLFPSGTGGDFRRTLGIPTEPRACAELLASRSTRRIDAGRIVYGPQSGLPARHFVNIADCGLGGEVVARVNRTRHIGGGTATFLYHSLAGLLTFEARPVRVDIDGHCLAGRAENVVIANGRYFGGGMRVAPDAAVDDGLLDVILIGEQSRTRSLLDIRHLYNGTHLGLAGVEHRRGRRVQVTPLSEAPLLFDVEGEQVGQAPATITCLPGALLFAAPPTGPD